MSIFWKETSLDRSDEWLFFACRVSSFVIAADECALLSHKLNRSPLFFASIADEENAGLQIR